MFPRKRHRDVLQQATADGYALLRCTQNNVTILVVKAGDETFGHQWADLFFGEIDNAHDEPIKAFADKTRPTLRSTRIKSCQEMAPSSSTMFLLSLIRFRQYCSGRHERLGLALRIKT